ncbi:MAG: hypothetical protein LBB34_04035 [Holosporales bacterium]|jgi:transposase-like protein|nr:hypothetical protein [Holosporales bacterium]
MSKRKIEKQKQRKLVEVVTARSTAAILNINKNTVASFFYKLKFLIQQ